jgi:hypothetical protein
MTATKSPVASVHADTDGFYLVVSCCPACGAPCRGPVGDSSTYFCTGCPWRGDGWVTLDPTYPAEPTQLKRHGIDQLTGGRVRKRRYAPDEP